MRPTRNADWGTGPLYRERKTGKQLLPAPRRSGLGQWLLDWFFSCYDENLYRALVLFDIDGTLVRRAGPHHREALVRGVRRVTGLETTTEGVPVHGMLDPDILTIMMRRAGAGRA